MGHLGSPLGAADPTHQAASFTRVLVYGEMLLKAMLSGREWEREWLAERRDIILPFGQRPHWVCEAARDAPLGHPSDDTRSGDEV